MCQCLSLALVLCGLDEVDGISVVGTFSLQSLWVSYFLRQSHTQIFSFSFS